MKECHHCGEDMQTLRFRRYNFIRRLVGIQKLNCLGCSRKIVRWSDFYKAFHSFAPIKGVMVAIILVSSVTTSLGTVRAFEYVQGARRMVERKPAEALFEQVVIQMQGGDPLTFQDYIVRHCPYTDGKTKNAEILACLKKSIQEELSKTGE